MEEKRGIIRPCHITKPVANRFKFYKDSEVEKFEVLGAGIAGTVYKATALMPDGSKPVVCVKEMTEWDNVGIEEKKSFVREGRLQASLNHPNIVKLIGITTETPILLILEFCEGGSLHGFLRTLLSSPNAAEFDLVAKLRVAYNVACGMAYLNDQQIIHRDLAARNCMLTGKPGVAKVTDFGLSRAEATYVSHDRSMIPCRWTSPEGLSTASLFSEASDVYAFGMTIVELFTKGDQPYPTMTNAKAKKAILAGTIHPRPGDMPADVYEALLVPCLQNQADKRPPFHDISTTLEKLL